MKPHQFDVISFITGLLITGVGLLFLIPRSTGALINAAANIGSWFWVVVFITVGVGILVPALISALRREDDQRISG